MSNADGRDLTPVGVTQSTSAAISPAVLRTLSAVAARNGVDLKPVLASVGLHEDLMSSPSLRVSYRQCCAVIQRALELTGDARLGLRVGAAERVTSWGLVGFAMLAAETVWDAMQTGVRYQELSGSMVIWSAGADVEGYVVRAELPDPSVDPKVAVFLYEKAFANAMIQTTRVFAGRLSLLRVEFAHRAPADRSLYDKLFDCPVVFGASANRIVYCPTQVHAPMAEANPVTFAAMIEVLDAQLAAGRVRQELLEMLEVSVAQSLPEVVSFAEQARRHAISERTLRRRLTASGTSYEAIVDTVRRERVEHLLRTTDLALGEIARAAGFADDRGLRRAIRRWHGMSAMELRRRLAGATGEVGPGGGARARACVGVGRGRPAGPAGPHGFSDSSSFG
jgi:AraC-like DNA-binding protein